MSIRKNIDTLLKRFEKEYSVHNHIEVSRSAILHNIDTFKQLTKLQIIPVLKGNAYGHGIITATTALKGYKLPYIAVDGYFEALRIREVSNQPVLVMGAILLQNFTRMKYDNFAFVVQDEATIHALGKTKKPINVHLECNTGMNRYGASSTEIEKLVGVILHYKNLTLEGVMSHLADSDGDNPKTVDTAVAIFDACVEKIQKVGANPTIIHVAQSAGSLKVHSKYANTIRLGIGTYGINPFPKNHALHEKLQAELRPALKLTSTITKVIQLNKGDQVSYNYTFTAPKKMKIGVLPLGYYEGVNRSLSNKGSVKAGNANLPIVGRVCMNHTMVSLEQSDCNGGDRVTVYSNNPADANSIDAIATNYNLFNYNLLTALSPDIRRTLVD
jgi:alanine racemase